MITNKNSDGYRLAQELVHIHMSQSKDKANEHFSSLLAVTPLVLWERLAIIETYNALLKEAV